jgi:hypothetical protein
MAFFDGLTFNPQGFGGQGGGLLDLLKRAAEGYQQYQPQPQNMDAPPIAVGDYMMPRHGPASLYEPQQKTADATMPPNAQLTQGRLPAAPQAQPEQPNHFMTGLQGFLGNLHNGPIGALAGGLGGLVTGQRTDPGGIAQQEANMTAQALVRGGLSPEVARAVTRNPDLLKVVLPEVLGFGGKTEDIKEYERAKKDPEFAKFLMNKRSTTGEYGLNYVYGTDEKTGETVAFAPGKSGVPKRVEFPTGVKLAGGTEKADAGTHWAIYDKRTGNLIRTEPKNVAEKESLEEQGKIQGQAKGELPAVELAAKRSISKIDEFLNDKGFDEVFGMLDQYRPNVTMSDDGRRALTRFNQMEGTAFLEGRSMLKGGGAITDFESKKAEAAFARLSRSLSENDAREALKDFKDAVNSGLEKLRAKAKGGTPSAAPAGAAAPAADPLGIR